MTSTFHAYDGIEQCVAPDDLKSSSPLNRAKCVASCTLIFRHTTLPGTKRYARFERTLDFGNKYLLFTLNLAALSALGAMPVNLS